jgi:hypothetical protein
MWMDNGDYYVCERFLDYYNLTTESGNINKNSPGCERKLSADKLVELVKGAYYASRCLAKKYWEHSICALLPDEQDNPEMELYGSDFFDRVIV